MAITKQQVFDAAWKGLKAQGFKRSMITLPDGKESCAYRGRNGRKCALGHFLTDEQAACMPPTLCGSGAFTRIGIADSGLLSFANALQSCHDSNHSPADMESGLREFAKAEGLTVPGDADPFQAFMAKVQEPCDMKAPDSIVLKNGVRFVQYDD